MPSIVKPNQSSYAEKLMQMPASSRKKLLGEFSNEECEALLHDWWFWGRPNQFPPQTNWYCWLVMAGRGFGKTRMGVEWVKNCVEGRSPLGAASDAPQNIALIAQTQAEPPEVLIRGVTGLIGKTQGLTPIHRP